ncbi:uncharacterized protein LOC143227438 [Tachypleus tridentatus]|uniref:uncharacterized protein LOC143227438 n=1 Tax=Tachypleus tridentatus TaxID=6853 RepID=UPI003FD57C38
MPTDLREFVKQEEDLEREQHQEKREDVRKVCDVGLTHSLTMNYTVSMSKLEKLQITYNSKLFGQPQYIHEVVELVLYHVFIKGTCNSMDRLVDIEILLLIFFSAIVYVSTARTRLPVYQTGTGDKALSDSTIKQDLYVASLKDCIHECVSINCKIFSLQAGTPATNNLLTCQVMERFHTWSGNLLQDNTNFQVYQRLPKWNFKNQLPFKSAYPRAGLPRSEQSNVFWANYKIMDGVDINDVLQVSLCKQDENINNTQGKISVIFQTLKTTFIPFEGKMMYKVQDSQISESGSVTNTLIEDFQKGNCLHFSLLLQTDEIVSFVNGTEVARCRVTVKIQKPILLRLRNVHYTLSVFRNIYVL